VFGYPNLYVVGGTTVPTPIGRNPSHTIAALAERIAGCC
jgi:choline dehydrogenase-like flavoprotein